MEATFSDDEGLNLVWSTYFIYLETSRIFTKPTSKINKIEINWNIEVEYREFFFLQRNY